MQHNINVVQIFRLYEKAYGHTLAPRSAPKPHQSRMNKHDSYSKVFSKARAYALRKLIGMTIKSSTMAATSSNRPKIIGFTNIYVTRVGILFTTKINN